MKKCILLGLFILTSTLQAQQVALVPYDFETFLAQPEASRGIKNPVYEYVIANYKPLSEPESTPSDAQRDCGFTQKFENGILYEKRNCGTAAIPNGEVITVTNADPEAILEWIESLNKMYGDFDQNVWNFEQTEYRPMDNLPGGFFNIIKNDDCTTVLVMSGC